MDSLDERQQQKWVDFIKQTHFDLRHRCKSARTAEEEDALWRTHLQSGALLSTYSRCMSQLACRVWRPRHDAAPHLSRVHWTHAAVLRQFDTPQLERARRYDRHLAARHARTVDCSSLDRLIGDSCGAHETLTFLDIGSCHNPFSGLVRLDVTAIDLCPSVGSAVLEADFLHVPLGACNVIAQASCTTESESGGACATKLVQLRAHGWHVICACLVLEYLPSARLRFLLCERAASLLQPGCGLLALISPDSQHATANSRLFRGWRLALATLGLQRVRYEKTAHLHCMLFRKSLCGDLVAATARQQMKRDAERLVFKQKFTTDCTVSVGNAKHCTTDIHSDIARRSVENVMVSCEDVNRQSDDNNDKITCNCASATPVCPEPYELMVIHQDLKCERVTSHVSDCDVTRNQFAASDICEDFAQLPFDM